MNELLRRTRFILCATTAFASAGMAFAQTAATPPTELNLGSVTASGEASGTGTGGAPSGTGSLKQAQKLEKLAPNVISVLPQSQIQKIRM
jgi:hypothetical protein